jgi:DNA polymerase
MSQALVEWIRFLYGDPLKVFSSVLRSTIVAPDGKILDVADFSQIEVRVLFWMAGHQEGLNAFIEGRDLYLEQAEAIYNAPAGSYTKDENPDERFLGKETILGCGFMMGSKRFGESCRKKGIPVSDELAKKSVNAYRRKHHPVPEMWGNIGRAAINAVRNPTRRFSVNKTCWYMQGDFLRCRLPSDRVISYYKPEAKYEPTPWGDKQLVLYYWGLDPKNKRKWVFSKCHAGLLTENVVQGTARDVMAEAMLRVEGAGPWQVVLSVHDECLAERKKNGQGTHEEFLKLMKEVPEWAVGLPIEVEGYASERYRK